VEKLHIKEYSWNSSYPEGWILGKIGKGIFNVQYSHYCSTTCFEKRHVDVEIMP
jgi:hypothetical protein